MVKHCCIAADIGGSNIRVSLVSDDLGIMLKLKEPSGGEPFGVLVRLIEELLSNLPAGMTCCGIGLAVAAIIDKTSGTILRAPNIQSFSGLGLIREIKDRFALTVIMENDANAAAYGERVAGAGRDFKDFIMLTLGTGIGGGIVIGGRLLEVAAEIGHSTINMTGPQCGCGNSGCLESYASATAIIGNAVASLDSNSESMLKDLHNGNAYKISAEDIYKAALEGDPLARTLLRDAGRALGIGIANMINCLSPQAVILTGGLLGAWNIYVEAAMAEASKRAVPELYERTQIIASSLGDDAGTVGMAALVFDGAKGRKSKNQ